MTPFTGEWLYSHHYEAMRPSARPALEHRREWRELPAHIQLYWENLAEACRQTVTKLLATGGVEGFFR